MNRDQFDHAVRAAAAVLNTSEVLVIGSQAIHASTSLEIPEVARSIEVDVSATEDIDGSKADLIDGSIGELSMVQGNFRLLRTGCNASNRGLTPRLGKQTDRVRIARYTGRHRALLGNPRPLDLQSSCQPGKRPSILQSSA